MPPYLWPWANNLNVGDETQIDEVFVGVNTRMREPIIEGFVDSNGPFNPAAILGENMNNAVGPQMSTWPNVNRVNAQGAFKAAPLRNVELTNPYFHDGGNLTLRQQLDFYVRGGNFPITNKAHRDFLIMNLLNEDEALGAYVVPSDICDPSAPLGSLGRVQCLGVSPDTAGAVPMFTPAQKEEIIVSVVDYLLELTDERVAFERAPFDHPEIFVPIDARASENVAGRGTVAGARGVHPHGPDRFRLHDSACRPLPDESQQLLPWCSPTGGMQARSASSKCRRPVQAASRPSCRIT